MAEITKTQIDNWGRVVLTDNDILELLYNGYDVTPDVLVEQSTDIDTYNEWCQFFDKQDDKLNIFSPLEISPEEFHTQRASQWLMPDSYKTIDLEEWLFERCTQIEQIERVQEEMELFKKYEMEDLLKFMIYMVENLRESKIWWGVGRGSSVSSYCLYLIGVHKIDSLFYDLDIREFIRE